MGCPTLYPLSHSPEIEFLTELSACCFSACPIGQQVLVTHLSTPLKAPYMWTHLASYVATGSLNSVLMLSWPVLLSSESSALHHFLTVLRVTDLSKKPMKCTYRPIHKSQRFMVLWSPF